MELTQEAIDFVNDPQTVDIIVRSTDYFLNFARDNPNILIARNLSGRFYIVYVARDYIETVIEVLGTDYISATPYALGLLGRQELQASGIIQIQEQPFLNLRGNGVLVGIVDTGIDYTLDTFRYEDGTSKIVSIYDQSAIGVPPEGFYLGTEYSREQINQALQSENPFSIVPQQDTVGHGTFLASVAAGREINDFIGAAPDAELIVVKLKDIRPYYRERYLIPDDAENVYVSTAVMLGVEFILDRARRLNRPVSICIGVGTNLGSHDGSSVFEDYLEEVANSSGVCVCTAVGNESQARHHTQGVIAQTGDINDIGIRVAESNTSLHLSVRTIASDRISLSIISPTGEVIGRVPAKSGTEYETRLILEQAIVNISYFYPLEGNSGQVSVVKIRNATLGVWTIRVHGDIILDGTFHSYLPMTGLGYPGIEFLSPDPNYTAVVPATGLGTIRCGAYDSNNNTLYFTSSWGPTLQPAIAPDLVAPGVNVAGVFPMGNGTMTGTSVAAAITAGACALMLQWGIVEQNDVTITTYRIKAFLIRGCERDRTLQYPNNQWGYGRLNLLNSFTMMRE